MVEMILADIDEVSQLISFHPNLHFEQYIKDIDETKSEINEGYDEFTTVTTSIVGWCRSSIPLLDKYLSSVTEKQAKLYKLNDILESVLNEGLQRIKTAQLVLGENKLEFNDLYGNIIELELRINENFNSHDNDFREQNRAFYQDLDEKVKALENHINDVKYQAKDELQVITDIKVQIKKTKGLVDLDKMPELRSSFEKQLIQFVKNTITTCKNYQLRHE